MFVTALLDNEGSEQPLDLVFQDESRLRGVHIRTTKEVSQEVLSTLESTLLNL